MKKTLLTLLPIALLSISLASCKNDDKTITVGATASPHAVVLNGIIGDILKEDGWDLKVETYGSYEVINPATESGALDANYFQHRPYLEESNKSDGTHLASACTVHYEPMGLFSGTNKTIDELDGSTIVIPNDATNRGRALNLLADNDLIELSKTDLTVTVDDITSNPHNLTIEEVAADAISTLIKTTDFAVVNGNYALAADINLDDALLVEDENSIAAETYANVIVVKEENLHSEKTEALVNAFADTRVKTFFEDTFGNAAIYHFEKI